MKKVLLLLLVVVIVTSFASCGNKPDNKPSSDNAIQKSQNSTESQNTTIVIKPSPDKYTWYIKNYVGKNLASFGDDWDDQYRYDEYGHAKIRFVIIAEDNSYVAPSDKESLKNYIVTAQNVEPNTELKLVFLKSDDGTEYSSLVESQNIEEIELYVKNINTVDSNSSIIDTTSSEVKKGSTSGDTDWKQFLKDYEAWVDDYIAIVKKYKDNPTDMSILSDYTEMISDMTEWTERADEIELELKDTDAAEEYSKEILRIVGKLAKAVS